MQNTTNKNLYIAFRGSLSLIIAVISAIVLPQIFHTIGLATGLGGKLGQMFLPMYLPVLIFAFKSNKILGLIAGIFSPIISFSLTGMPTLELLPFITIELAAFGLFAGILAGKKINPLLKVLLVQVLSKLVRIVATLISAYFITKTALLPMAILSTVTMAIPGYLLQLIIVPFFIGRDKN